MNTWTSDPKNRIGKLKKIISNFSLYVRKQQLRIMINLLKPSNKDKVLDVGFSPAEKLVDTNFFEKHYPFKSQITAVSVEDCSKIKKLYPVIKIIQVKPNSKLPFPSKYFDIVTSWATLEHVGDYKHQEFFLKEMLRVGKKVFVTTPYRGCVYEPHTNIFILHWLPLKFFRFICRMTGKLFWASPSNLNPLYKKDIKKMIKSNNVNIQIFNSLHLIPSHLIVFKI